MSNKPSLEDFDEFFGSNPDFKEFEKLWNQYCDENMTPKEREDFERHFDNLFQECLELWGISHGDDQSTP